MRGDSGWRAARTGLGVPVAREAIRRPPSFGVRVGTAWENIPSFPGQSPNELTNELTEGALRSLPNPSRPRWADPASRTLVFLLAGAAA